MNDSDNTNRCEYRTKFPRRYHCPSHYHHILEVAGDDHRYCSHHADVVSAILGKPQKELEKKHSAEEDN